MTNLTTKTDSSLINVVRPVTKTECKRALDHAIAQGAETLLNRQAEFLGGIPDNVRLAAAQAASLYAPKALTARDAARAAAVRAEKKGLPREEIEVKVGRAIQAWERASAQAQLRYNLVAALMCADIVESHALALRGEVDQMRLAARHTGRKLTAEEKKAHRAMLAKADEGVILAEQVRSEATEAEAAAS